MLESPKYHVARGHPEKAIETLQAMARFNDKAELDLHVSDFTKLTSKEEKKRKTSSSRVSSLFENLTPLFATRKEATTTILVTLIWTIGNLGKRLEMFECTLQPSFHLHSLQPVQYSTSSSRSSSPNSATSQSTKPIATT